MPRMGLTPESIGDAAVSLVDREGVSALTLARLAEELGVRAPSLYNHVSGVEGLMRMVALKAVDELAEVCRTAVMGKSGEDGLRSLAGAYRAFALAHPGRYQLSQVVRPQDPEYEEKAARVLEPVVALLRGFGLSESELIHAARALRSALHGFTMLETQHGFGLEVDLGESFEWMLNALARAFRA